MRSGPETIAPSAIETPRFRVIVSITRARVTQIMNLTLLAPDIQQEVLALKTRYANHPVTERKLRQVAHVGDWAAQRARFTELLAQAGTRAHGANGGA